MCVCVCVRARARARAHICGGEGEWVGVVKLILCRFLDKFCVVSFVDPLDRCMDQCLTFVLSCNCFSFSLSSLLFFSLCYFHSVSSASEMSICFWPFCLWHNTRSLVLSLSWG